MARGRELSIIGAMNRNRFMNDERINRLKIGDRIKLKDGARYKIIDHRFNEFNEKVWVGRRGGNNLKLIYESDWEKIYE